VSKIAMAAAAALMLFGASSCISKGDTNIEGDSGSGGTSGGSLCAQYCNKIGSQGCNLNPNCETNCTQNARSCLDVGDYSSDYYLECVLQNPMTCGSTGDPNVPACAAELDAALACASGGGSCAPAGDPCDSVDCCDDSTCVSFPEYGGSYCALKCTADGDCASGCCGALEGGGTVCGPAEYCESSQGYVGDICTTNSDCISDYCEIWWETPPGYCSTECSTNDDCGVTGSELQNICVDGTCSPGCGSDGDCTAIADGTLACMYDANPAETFCFPPN
jgi:hypothetical protein